MMNRYPNFAWWQGVVEDRNDPEQFGRYRVRIIGYHTLDKNILPTESLPWSIPMQPVTSAAISGVGSSPTGLVEGSTVIGFFVDGEDGQIPVIMGSFGVEDNVPTIDDKDTPESPESLAERGFYDPNGKFPRRKELKISEDESLADKVKGMVSDGLGGILDAEGNKLTGLAEGVDEVDVGKNVLGEASSSRLARGDMSENHYSLKGKRETRIGAKDDGVPRGFATKISGWNNTELPYEHDNGGEDIPVFPGLYEPTFWEEPHPQGSEISKSQYPYNHVRETESGHVFEVDDTPDAERIHEYHTAGTFREIQPDGTKVEKIVGEDYVIDLKSRYMYVRGDFNLMVEGDYNINVKGNKYEHISGHSYNTVMGNRLNKIQGHELVDTQSSYLLMTAGNFNCQVGQSDKDQKKIGNYRLRVLGEMNETVQGKHKIMGGNDFKHIVKGDIGFTTALRTGLDPTAALEAASAGAAPSPDALVQGGSIKLEAIQKVDIAAAPTDLPKVPGSPLGGVVSIVSDRINTTARVDYVERVGPVSVPFPAQIIGNKRTYVVNPSGVGGIQNTLIGAGVIENNITGVGAINNFVTGAGFINNAIAGAGTIIDTTGAALPTTFGTPSAIPIGTSSTIMTNASLLTVTPIVDITAITNITGVTSIVGATSITGATGITGTLTVTGLVTGGSTVLQTHTHNTPVPGGSSSGTYQTTPPL
tara:strand:+ start:11212 stop:13320 length:2109 start_codon:yes stop_codon:yes gene_type:complete